MMPEAYARWRQLEEESGETLIKYDFPNWSVTCIMMKFTVLFTKPPSSVLPVVGTTSETIPAAAGIVLGKVMERPGTVRLPALRIALLKPVTYALKQVQS